MYLPLVANNNLIAQLFSFLFFVFFLAICCVAWRLYFSYQALYNLHSIYSPIELRFISLWYDRLLCSHTFIDLTFYILYNWINLYLNGRKGKVIEEGNPLLWRSLHFRISFFAYFTMTHNSNTLIEVLLWFLCDILSAPKTGCCSRQIPCTKP